MGGSQAQFDQLRLIRSPNIGPVSYRQLIGRFGNAKPALEALPDLVRRGGGGPSLLADEASVTRELQIVERFGGHHIFIGDPEYPSLLSHLDNAPPVFMCEG